MYSVVYAENFRGVDARLDDKTRGLLDKGGRKESSFSVGVGPDDTFYVVYRREILS